MVVFSSGNEGLNEVSDYAKNSIAVGALNKYDMPGENDYVIGQNSRYTNIGSTLDLVAYGGNLVYDIQGNKKGDIRTLDRVGSFGYTTTNYTDEFGATSAACPQVSGAAALILSVNPNLTRQEVENILFSTATDLGTPDRDNTYGYGKLNIFKALIEATETLNQYLYWDSGSLPYQKIIANSQIIFSESPGCGIAAGMYWCDVYKAEQTFPSVMST